MSLVFGSGNGDVTWQEVSGAYGLACSRDIWGIAGWQQ